MTANPVLSRMRVDAVGSYLHGDRPHQFPPGSSQSLLLPAPKVEIDMSVFGLNVPKISIFTVKLVIFTLKV